MTDYSLRMSEEELGRYRMMAASATAAEEAWWAEAGIVEGAQVVDLGCGPGAVLVELANRIGPDGRIVGVDQGEESLEVARKLIAEAGLGHAEVRRGDATATGLEAGAWDVVMIRHVLAHNPPEVVGEIVAHIAELLRPGGHAYLVDSDGTGFRYERQADPDLLDIMDRYQQMLRARGSDATTGPRLGAIAEDAGLEIVDRRPRITAIPFLPGLRPPAWAAREAMKAEGHCTDDDIARWDAAFARSDQAPAPNWMFGPIYTVIARRP